MRRPGARHLVPSGQAPSPDRAEWTAHVRTITPWRNSDMGCASSQGVASFRSGLLHVGLAG